MPQPGSYRGSDYDDDENVNSEFPEETGVPRGNH